MGYSKGLENSLNHPGLIKFGEFASDIPKLWEVPLFMLLGVVGGLFGALFISMNKKIMLLRRKYTKDIKTLTKQAKKRIKKETND